MLKVILHIDENHKWNTLLSNVKNLKEWLIQNKEPGKIEILVNGEALEMVLKASPVRNAAERLHSRTRWYCRTRSKTELWFCLC